MIDFIFAAIALIATLYLYLDYEGLVNRQGILANFEILGFKIPYELILGSFGIILLLEATRRAIGIPLVVIALIFLFMLSVIETLLFNEDSLYFNFVGNEKMPVSRNSLRRFMFVNLFVSIGPMVMYLIKDKKRLHVRIVEKPIWRHEVVTNDAISDFRTTALDMQHLLEGLQKLETSVEKNWKEMQEFIHSRSGMNRTFTSSGLRQISLALNQQHSDKTVQTLGMEASEELCLTNKYNNKPTSIVEIEIEEEEEKHVHVSERKETQTKSSTRQQTFSHSHSHTSVHDFMIDHIRKLEKHREEHDRIIKESVKSVLEKLCPESTRREEKRRKKKKRKKKEQVALKKK